MGGYYSIFVETEDKTLHRNKYISPSRAGPVTVFDFGDTVDIIIERRVEKQPNDIYY